MLLSQIQQSVRALRRVLGLTMTSILTVALGVGVGTAMFSVVKAVLLNPLPYPEPGRIAWVAEINDAGQQTQVALRNLLDWREQNNTFLGLAAYGDGPSTVTFNGLSQSTRISIVSEDFFDVLGSKPGEGRTFSPAEQKTGADRMAVIGYGLWQRVFGGDPSVIGRSFRVAGGEATVIGVMPPGFSYPDRAEVWMPLAAFGDPGTTVRTGHYWRAVGRLRTGATWAQARMDLTRIEERIKREYPSVFQAKDVSVVPLIEHVVGQARSPLLMLFSAVGFLLLIVCVNVANLLLVRVTTRTRELGVRIALGASTHHLIRQMLTESMLQALAGGMLGMLLASWSLSLLRSLLPAELPRGGEIDIDFGVGVFSLAVSVASGLLFGILPAWRACRTNLNEALKSDSRSATGGRQSQRIQAALVISEVCLSLVLVAGAGLLIRSYWNLRAVDPGFRADHVLTANISFAPQPGLVSKYRDLLDRVAAIPGVEVVGTTRSLPIEGVQQDGHFFIEGRLDQAADAGYVVISPGFFKALQIPLMNGREFNALDSEDGQPVAVVSAKMAQTFWPGANPIGQRIWFDSYASKPLWLTIVGVAGDTRQTGLADKPYPIAYVCYTQQQVGHLLAGGTLVARTRSDPAALGSAIAKEIRAVNPEAVPTPRTLETVLTESLARQRFQMQMLMMFGGLALVLAAVGIYGVLSYMVTANKAQISVRLALGADPGSIFRLVVGRAMALCCIGLVLGVAGCLMTGRVLTALLFGVGPADSLTIGAAVVALMTVALVAAWAPARSAMNADPMMVLRDD
jgi:predicted permease